MATDKTMQILCYMAVASDLFSAACDTYSEGEEIEDVKARLHLTQEALDTIQKLIVEEQRR